MAAILGPRSLVTATALWITSSSLATAWAHDTHIVFDLPPSIECRDVTPDDFRAAHSTLKVVEGTLRISARVAQGAESEIVDFLYVIEGPTNSMRFQDYLPNTFLESTVADDQIAISTGSENVNGGGLDAHVVYKPVTVGGQLNHNEKKSESSCYKKIVPKELVLASGTTNREHGVFFRLRPSRRRIVGGRQGVHVPGHRADRLARRPVHDWLHGPGQQEFDFLLDGRAGRRGPGHGAAAPGWRRRSSPASARFSPCATRVRRSASQAQARQRLQHDLQPHGRLAHAEET